MSQSKPTFVEVTKYAEHWIFGGDQTASWRKAFRSSKANQKVAHEKASSFHKLKKVQERISKLQNLLKIQSEEKFGLTAQQIKEKLATAANEGLEFKTDAQGNTIPVSIPGAVSALSEINKMDGNHAATKLALGGDPDAPPIETKITVTHEVI